MAEKPLTPEEIAILSPYVTNVDKPIFALKNLPEEVVAVLFAYYSRSKETLRRNLLKLLQEKDVDLEERTPTLSLPPGGEGKGEEELKEAKAKARQFHEKWVVGYGHASVAEHAVVHLAIEDVSIITTKIIEDMRLAAYTEKSTRYVIFEEDKFYCPPVLLRSPYASLYRETAHFLLKTYVSLFPQVIEHVKAEYPRKPDQSERAYDSACRAKACDILRYIIPAGTLTNLGMTINGRALEHLLTKLFSHPLEEAREIAQLMKEEALKIIPTLIKYADYNAYMAETDQAMRQVAGEIFPSPTSPLSKGEGAGGGRPAESRPVILVRYPEDAEEQLVAAILYGYTNRPMTQVLETARKLNQEERERIIDEYLRRRGPHDQPLRALEHLYYTFDILVDYGAFRDIHRHRMATQTRQDLTIDHGYETPEELVRYGLKETFDRSMERAAEAYAQIAKDFPLEAQYIVPLAYRIRVLFTWNLRELHHFIQLRSGRQGHISYRRIAQQVFKELERVHPLLARYIRVDLSEYELGRL
ncbi:MAG: FAD-dependent thymidylate synthase [Candidatus Methylomirabilales bacterium]